MPRVKVDYIVSFSSESPEAPASNLLANEAGHGRWLCARGEPSCSVLLQLPKAVQISSITVGAHLAALVEVLVGRTETPNDPFQVLVASSVFLSPIESRRAKEGDTAADRVRSFNTEQLAADVRGKRWDRLRVVCSQPYNKHCKYGLSFIHIFSPEGDATNAPSSSKPVQNTMKDSNTGSSLTLKLPLDISPQDSDDDDLKPGALFAQHRAKQSQSQSQSQDSSSSTDSQIRKATSQAIKNVFNTSTKIVRTPISKPKGSASSDDGGRSDRKRESLMYDYGDDGPNDKIDRLVAAHKDQQAKEAEKERAIKEKERQEKEKARKEKAESESSKHKKDDSTHNQTPKEKHKDRNTNDSHKDRRDDRNKTPHSSKKERGRRDDRSRSPHSSKRDRTSSSKQEKDDRSDKKQKGSKDQDTGKTLYAGPVSDKPHELLRDVVFVLSGYENPRRANVRDAALAMGAQFQRDWHASCTHLICAFPNTPKLKTVRSSPDGNKAIIVTAEWVERQADRCRRLPWQWFATEHKFRVQRSRAASGEDPPGTSRQDSEPEHRAKDDTGVGDRQVKEEDRKRKKGDKTPDSECDTDDEIERVMRLNAQKRSRNNSDEESSRKKKKADSDNESPNKSKDDSDVANVSHESDVAFVCDERIRAQITLSDEEDATDEEDVIEDTPELSTIEQLPSFFEGCTFALHANETSKSTLDDKLLRRYVKAYGGEIVEPIDDGEDLEVDYVLCLSGDTVGVRAKGTCLRGDWVWQCHQRKRLCSPGEFAL